MNPTIQIENLSYQLPNGKNLFSKLNATISFPGMYKIDGPSGAGKSTLLKLLCRLLEPTQGRILFQNQDYRELDPKYLRQNINLLFQAPKLLGPTIRDDLLLSYRYQGKITNRNPSNLEDSLIETLEKLNLSAGILNQSSMSLSQGQAQRIAIGRSLLQNPKILLLDEPTSSLDQDSKKKIRQLLNEIGKEKLVILVSHDEEDFQGNSKNILILKKFQ